MKDLPNLFSEWMNKNDGTVPIYGLNGIMAVMNFIDFIKQKEQVQYENRVDK